MVADNEIKSLILVSLLCLDLDLGWVLLDGLIGTEVSGMVMIPDRLP